MAQSLTEAQIVITPVRPIWFDIIQRVGHASVMLYLIQTIFGECALFPPLGDCHITTLQQVSIFKFSAYVGDQNWYPY
jgi:hypothetical protein